MTDYQIIVQSNALYIDACALPKIDIETTGHEAQLTRLLVYLSQIPVFCSFVGFGEFFHVAGKKATQRHIGISGYLFSCRALMIDVAQGKLHRAEPVEDKLRFFQLAQRLEKKFSSLGGGDIWHLMSALELQRQYDDLAVFSFDNGLVKAAKSEGLDAVNGVTLDPDQLAEELKRNGKLLGY